MYKGVYTKETDTDLEVLDVAIKKLQGKHSPHLQCNFIKLYMQLLMLLKQSSLLKSAL